ncbi:KEOPS complex subunit Pcc1 [Methanoplanus limicola]|uniref:KEOPS complex Pcc1-like subunit n=1 Tax=Methanoplanus limicola DSM 2279 TaxID=937775 RepID=H1Z2A9_9EURY|nr:KEOPS complex subunit Pcc1 [Methanoplanus limicola]EHQ34638.1 Protein of unknown function DUF2144 [Methanoplanus limicola DSM 2279]
MSLKSDMIHEAVFSFQTSDAGLIYESVLPEADDESGRSFAEVILNSDTEVLLRISAKDIHAMRAALNTWLRLINIANEMKEVIDS